MLFSALPPPCWFVSFVRRAVPSHGDQAGSGPISLAARANALL